MTNATVVLSRQNPKVQQSSPKHLLIPKSEPVTPKLSKSYTDDTVSVHSDSSRPGTPMSRPDTPLSDVDVEKDVNIVMFSNLLHRGLTEAGFRQCSNELWKKVNAINCACWVNWYTVCMCTKSMDACTVHCYVCIFQKALNESSSYYRDYTPTIVSAGVFGYIGKKLIEKYPCLIREGTHDWSAFTRILSQRLRTYRCVYFILFFTNASAAKSKGAILLLFCHSAQEICPDRFYSSTTYIPHWYVNDAWWYMCGHVSACMFLKDWLYYFSFVLIYMQVHIKAKKSNITILRKWMWTIAGKSRFVTTFKAPKTCEQLCDQRLYAMGGLQRSGVGDEAGVFVPSHGWKSRGTSCSGKCAIMHLTCNSCSCMSMKYIWRVYSLQTTHLRRRQNINEWEQNGEERMAFSVFEKFPALKDDRFLFRELAMMNNTTAKDLQARVSAAFKSLQEKVKIQKYEVRISKNEL